MQRKRKIKEKIKQKNNMSRNKAQLTVPFLRNKNKENH